MWVRRNWFMRKIRKCDIILFIYQVVYYIWYIEHIMQYILYNTKFKIYYIDKYIYNVIELKYVINNLF